VRVATTVTAIRGDADGGVWVDWDENRDHFDKVICTSPVDILKRLASEGLVDVDQADGQVEYLGVVCLVVITRRPITPYYVLNIADSRVPFTGVIGMSTIVSTDETAGLYVTYFPKYVLSTDALLQQYDNDVRRQFLGGLALMFPEVREEDIVSAHIHRAARVQPLQVLHYSRLVPTVTTGHADLFVLNTSQFVNSTLNNNEVIRAVDNFLLKYGARLEQSRDGCSDLVVATG
jgi:protoporphyrinogen oxidase